MPSNLNTPEAIFKLGERHSQAVLWRAKKELYRLVGSVCLECHKKHFPRRWICGYCGSRKLEETQLCHTGRILYIQMGGYGEARGYEDTRPQLFALVQLDDGPLVETGIVNVPADWIKQEILDPKEYALEESLKGKRVRMVFRRHRKFDNGNLSYGFRFVIEDPPWRDNNKTKVAFSVNHALPDLNSRLRDSS